ncbi:hypothetical protein TB2_041816 [Malus domestica]
MSKSLKGHEPCNSPNNMAQRYNPWPQPHKLPLVLAKSSSLKQWSLPQYLIGPCQADSWPMPTDVPHHPDCCPAVAPSTKKKKKATKDGHLHGQDVEDC